MNDWKSLSRVRLFATTWTIQSVVFSRPEYWSGLPFPSPGDLPNPGIEPRSPTLQADCLPAEPHKMSYKLMHNISTLQSLLRRFRRVKSNRTDNVMGVRWSSGKVICCLWESICRPSKSVVTKEEWCHQRIPLLKKWVLLRFMSALCSLNYSGW